MPTDTHNRRSILSPPSQGGAGGGSSSLVSNLNSQYISAANRLQGRKGVQRIVAYTESYDDILFWNNLLSEVEDEVRDTTGRKLRFEVMLPSRTSLGRGKKIALGNRLGPNMIACVDADYDYLHQGATPISEIVCTSPYVLHTYAYAIENLQCYAPTLQRVCVMATLNDKEIFDFRDYLSRYSQTIYRLFIWNVWVYRYGLHTHFSLSHFAEIVAIDDFSLNNAERTLELLKNRCNKKMAALQRQFPQGRDTYKPLQEQLAALGVTPETTYLYMRGHDLFDHVVGPILDAVCTRLRRDREAEISRLACHSRQCQNELASYQHSCAPWAEMLRKHDAFHRASLYKRIIGDALRLTATPDKQAAPSPDTQPTNTPD